MLKEKRIFKVNFDENVKNYDFKDGIISLLYVLYIVVLLYLFGLLMFKTNIYNNLESYLKLNNKHLFKDIFYISILIFQLIPIFILIKLRKQNIKSIGLKKDKNLKSIIIGVIFSIPFIAPSIFNAINQGKHIISFINLILLFLFYLIEIAFAEELAFRGFIQTRIQGLIKAKWLSIIIVGIMFGLMHIPFQMLKANMPLGEFIINDSFHLIFTCFIHIYLVYLYTRDNNIISTTIAHALIDFIPTIFI